MRTSKKAAERVLICFVVAASLMSWAAMTNWPSLDEALAAKEDVWGLAAMGEPNGPSYESFEKLLPPLRYVNAEFRHYPIVLSAPNATVKARLTSNGSGLNARANLKTWKEVGVPITFRVGDDEMVFGEDPYKRGGPRYDRGLPSVSLRYDHDGKIYLEDAFAAVEPALAEHGVVFVQFLLASIGWGKVTARLDAPRPWLVSRGVVQNTNGQTVAWFDDSWEWDPLQNKLTTHFAQPMPTLAFATKPLSQSTAASLEETTADRISTGLYR